jgi:hypothetical protein
MKNTPLFRMSYYTLFSMWVQHITGFSRHLLWVEKKGRLLTLENH